LTRDRRLLAGLLALFVVLLFCELPGSWLLEPDEARYAEIPREMLSAGDPLALRLNGASFFEKPPLLYWANAASMAVLGHTSFAARLPTRLAALATAGALLLALESAAAPGAGLLAALLLLSAPLSFALGRINLTDGLLTFGITVSMLALRRFFIAREAGARARGALVALGVGCAIAVLTKGLVGIVFPGLVALFWIAITRRWRLLKELIVSPAPLVFAVLTVPCFALLERENPGFLRIFVIREHFLRYATPVSDRPGPPYFFLGVFLLGFLPWVPMLVRSLRRQWQARGADTGWRDDKLFFVLWFLVILIFFSVSKSKLIPYILPAFPAAAALVALEVTRTVEGGLRGDARESDLRVPLLAQAIMTTVLIGAGLVFGVRSGALREYDAVPAATFAVVLLLAGAWAGVLLARRGRLAIAAVAGGWAAVYAVLAFTLPRVANELSAHRVATLAAGAGATRVVAYDCYPQLLPWVVGEPVAVVGYRGELGSDGKYPPELYWTREEFWRRWKSPERLAVVTTWGALGAFAETLPPDGRPLGTNRKYVVVTNFPTGGLPLARVRTPN
jgi:4-amino-4-deoxy-L-arabinose transferase-like glycosyltransferase